MPSLCCCPSSEASARRRSDAPSTCARATRVVFAILALGVMIFGILGAIALHDKLSASAVNRFKHIASALQIDLVAFAAIFISTGFAGLFACYCLVPKKAGRGVPDPAPDEADQDEQPAYVN